MTRGTWASLFSGGKDSSWVLFAALREGLELSRLVTVHPPADSYLYHVPGTRLARLAAESIGIELYEVEPSFTIDDGDAGRQGDRELVPLEAALRTLDDELGLAGVTTGAVESEYQTSRIRGMCDRLGIALFAPLWRADPHRAAMAMLDAGFEIVVVRVAARGLDASWLGRRLDTGAFDELQRLNTAYGVHLLGEGGEYETLVVDGPHMDQRIGLDYAVEWDGVRGELRIDDAWLE